MYVVVIRVWVHGAAQDTGFVYLRNTSTYTRIRGRDDGSALPLELKNRIRVGRHYTLQSRLGVDDRIRVLSRARGGAGGVAVVAFVFTSPKCENVGRWYSYIFVFAGRGSRFVDALPLSGKLTSHRVIAATGYGLRAASCGAVRYDTMRCDAMRCDADAVFARILGIRVYRSPRRYSYIGVVQTNRYWVWDIRSVHGTWYASMAMAHGPWLVRPRTHQSIEQSCYLTIVN
ncbi:hypothetical protein U1Q18_051562 [Sarracenia purpurea var. burkii]